MKKIAILNDLHFGANGAKDVFLYELLDFLDDFLNRITKSEHILIIAGDILDDRRSTNTKILNAFLNFLNKLEELGIETYISLGNHDIYYKNDLNPNSLLPIIKIGRFKNITLVDKPIEIYNICLVPWICQSNKSEVEGFINNTKCNILIGHFDIIGFEMQSGIKSTNGYDISYFKKFDLVLSGHYHKKSIMDNIVYMGSQYQFKWSDSGQTKGFHILDAKTLKLEFIENKNELYKKIYIINDSINDQSPIEWLKANKESLNNKFVKVFISGKYDSKNIENFIYQFNHLKINTHELSIIDNMTEIVDELDIIENEIKDFQELSTQEMFMNTIDSITLNDKLLTNKGLKDITLQVFNEAIDL